MPASKVLDRLADVNNITHGQEGATARLLVEQGAVELAQTASRLLELVPGDGNPLVLDRKMFAGLQAALDNYVEAGEDLVDDVLGWELDDDEEPAQ